MKSSELVRILMNDGWVVVSQRGSHVKMAHKNKRNILYVPFHGSREVGIGLAKKILKAAEIL